MSRAEIHQAGAYCLSVTGYQVLKSLGSCATVEQEYWYHVAPQTDMPLAGEPKTFQSLEEIHDVAWPSPVTKTGLAEVIFETPQIVKSLRVLGALSDKRLYLDLSYLFSRIGDPDDGKCTVCGCSPDSIKRHSTDRLISLMRKGSESRRRLLAQVVSDYLVEKDILSALNLYLQSGPDVRSDIAKLWLYPKDVQQNEAKRRGHGAEAEVASMFEHTALSITPKDKASNPMGALDPNVSKEDFEVVPHSYSDSFSTDLLVKDPNGDLVVMVMALVQSSDPGQFGVDKTKTNAEIRKRLDNYKQRSNSKLEMWGILDGVGYAENPNGTLVPMLAHFHEFIQHNSLYKVFLALHRMELVEVEAVSYDSSFYSERVAQQMHERYANREISFHYGWSDASSGSALSAGRARVQLRR